MTDVGILLDIKTLAAVIPPGFYSGSKYWYRLMSWEEAQGYLREVETHYTGRYGADVSNEIRSCFNREPAWVVHYIIKQKDGKYSDLLVCGFSEFSYYEPVLKGYTNQGIINDISSEFDSVELLTTQQEEI